MRPAISLVGWDQVIPRRFAYRFGRLDVVDRAAQCQCPPSLRAAGEYCERAPLSDLWANMRLGLAQNGQRRFWVKERRACVDFFEDKRAGCRHNALRVGGYGVVPANLFEQGGLGLHHSRKVRFHIPDATATSEIEAPKRVFACELDDLRCAGLRAHQPLHYREPEPRRIVQLLRGRQDDHHAIGPPRASLPHC